MIYRFFWDDGKECMLLEILARSTEAVEPKAIEKLLDEYRKDNEDYNIDDWCDFLAEHGYAVRLFKPDYSMYF